MLKKRFFQLNIGWLLVLLFFFIEPIVVVTMFIKECIALGYFSWFYFIFSLILIVPFCMIIFALEKHRIVLRKNDIFVPADWLGRRAKIQFKTIIKYEEIQDIRIIRSVKNSLDKKITTRMPNSFVLKPYLEFTCNKEKKKYIFIMYFSKKQWVKIIDNIKVRMLDVGNNVILLDTNQIIANSNLSKQNSETG